MLPNSKRRCGFTGLERGQLAKRDEECCVEMQPTRGRPSLNLSMLQKLALDAILLLGEWRLMPRDLPALTGSSSSQVISLPDLPHSEALLLLT